MENQALKRFLLFLSLFIASAFHMNAQTYLFPDREIITHGANDWKAFSIDGHQYLAVASFQDNNSVEIESVIFDVDAGYDTLQLIPTSGASDWEFFSVDGEYFLGVANFIDDQGVYTVNSTIYRFEDGSWEYFQHIPTEGAYDLEFLDAGEEKFLAVANQRDGENSYFIASDIYRWNGDSLVLFQEIPTYGASDWEGFMLNDVPCFAVANTFYAASQIYVFNGNTFSLLQSIPSLGATGIETFSIGDQFFLSIANGRSIFSYTTESVIYTFNGDDFQFFQSVETTGAFDWEYFTFDNQHFLACASYRDDNANYDLDSPVFRWQNESFELIDLVPTHGAVDWEFFVDNGEPALSVSNYKLGANHITNSVIYHFDRNALFAETLTQPEPPVLFPNPSSEMVNIQGVTGLGRYAIFDSYGRVIQDGSYSGDFSFRVSSISNGMYHIMFYESGLSISFSVAQ